MKSKNLFVSKTFWLNVIGIGLMVVPGVPLDPQVAGYVLGGLNIAMRLITQGPAHVVKDAATEP